MAEIDLAALGLDQSFFKLLVDNTRELICLHKEDGRYLYLSPSIKTYTGFGTDELVGKNPYDFFHPDDQEYVKKNSHLPAIEGIDDFIVEYRFKKKEGGYIWFQSLTKQIKIKGEVYLITSSREISKKVELRRQLSKYKTLLDQAAEMTKIGAWDFDLESKQPYWSPVVYDIHEVPFGEQPNLKEALNFYDEGESRDSIIKHFENATEKGTPFDLTLRFTGAKGTKKWVRTICHPEMYNGKVTRVYGVFQDVTLEKEKMEQTERLAQILQKQKNQLSDFNKIVSHNLRSPISNLPILVDLLESEEDEGKRQQLLDLIKNSSESMSDLLNDLVDIAKASETGDLDLEELNIEQVLEKVKSQFLGTINKLNAKFIFIDSGWNQILYSRIYLESILHNLISNALKYSSEKEPELKIECLLINDVKHLRFSDNGTGIDLKRHGKEIFKLNKTFNTKKPGKGLGLFMTKQQIVAMGGEISVSSQPNKGSTFHINFNIKD